MNIIVQKYGGSSLSNKSALKNICKRINYYLKNKDAKLVVVVSAQGKTTDNLIKLSKYYTKSQDKKSLDFLLATGEMKSAALLSMMLNEQNIKSTPLTGWQAGILTDSTYGEAKIIDIYKQNILKALESNSVVIVTGFQGVTKLGDITTLGRGGSDLSATALAAKLNAISCEIYSDIDGVFSTDPKIFCDASLIKKISYDEMIEASSAGAKVMHNRSVMVAKKFSLPLKIKNSRSSYNSNNGTIIEDTSKGENIEKSKIKMITKKDELTEISIIGEMMLSNIDITKDIYQIANKLNSKIYMITFSELAIHLITDTKNSEEFLKSLHNKLIAET